VTRCYLRLQPLVVLMAAFALPAPMLAEGDGDTASPSAEDGSSAPGRRATLAPAQQAEKLWTLRRAQAQPIDFFMPYYSIQGDLSTSVFLMNPIADTISVTVTALDGHGAELPLGTYGIEPRHHLELSLNRLLRGFERELGTGSLRLSLLGDGDRLQGWTVLMARDGQTFEIPIASPEKATATGFYSFWDLSGPALTDGRAVRFEVLNTSSEPRRIDVTTQRKGHAAGETLVLPPRARLQLDAIDRRPLGDRGWIKLRHDGSPGDVVTVGLVVGPHPIATLPLVSLGEASERRRYESMPLPRADASSEGRSGVGDTELVLFRPGAPGDPVQPVTIEALDAASGSVLGSATTHLAPGEIRSVSLRRTLPVATATDARDPPAPPVHLGAAARPGVHDRVRRLRIRAHAVPARIRPR
jgi:hypothetical protein